MDKTWTEKKSHARKEGMRGPHPPGTFSLASRLRWCSIPCRCWWSRWRWYIWCFMPEHRWLSWSWGALFPVSSAQSFESFDFRPVVEGRLELYMMKSSPPPQKKGKPECKYLGKNGKVATSPFLETRLQKRCCPLAPQKVPLEKLSLEESYANWSMIFCGSTTCFETCTGRSREMTKIYHTGTDCPGQIDIYNYIPWWH